MTVPVHSLPHYFDLTSFKASLFGSTSVYTFNPSHHERRVSRGDELSLTPRKAPPIASGNSTILYSLFMKLTHFNKKSLSIEFLY